MGGTPGPRPAKRENFDAAPEFLAGFEQNAPARDQTTLTINFAHGLKASLEYLHLLQHTRLREELYCRAKDDNTKRATPSFR